VDLVELYERRTARPERPVDPVEVIKAEMELNGRTRGDLAALPGQNRATEILARRRPLTLAMIRRLNAAWGVPADLLIGAYETAAAWAVWNVAAELSALSPENLFPNRGEGWEGFLNVGLTGVKDGEIGTRTDF